MSKPRKPTNSSPRSTAPLPMTMTQPIETDPPRDARDQVLARAQREHERFVAMGEARLARIWGSAANHLREAGNPALALALARLIRLPVTIDQFIDDPDYLGGKISIWPALREDVRAMNPDILAGETPVFECLLGGATGTGKTTLAIVTMLYRLYLFTCFDDIHALFKLAPRTPIVFMFQSVSPVTTERVLYRPFRRHFETIP